MGNVKIIKAFLHEQNTKVFVHNLEVVIEALGSSTEIAQAIATMEVARQLDRIATALEQK